MERQEVNDMKTPKGIGIVTYEQLFRIIDKLQQRVEKLETKVFTVGKTSDVKLVNKVPNIIETKDKKKVNDK